MELNSESEMKSSVKLVIEKFIKKGFDSLSSEDLGIAITHSLFE
jgi:hypothetical protein